MIASGLPPLRSARNYYKRHVARLFFQGRLKLELTTPLISFTFDDFPRSALQAGGASLRSRGLNGTYYVSLGRLGLDSPSGPLCNAADVIQVLEDGHELGCHTFSHCHSWETDGKTFEEELKRNRTALEQLVPGASFKSFAYPISEPRPSVKRATATYFLSSRAGGQKPNAGTVDLNQLSAYFLEKTRGDLQPVKDVIQRNRQLRGWLVFATHDVADTPSPFGCAPGFFDLVVEEAARSGAQILPIIRALEVIGASAPDSKCREISEPRQLRP